MDLILETLRLCVEELDVIHQPLLDTVLIQLLPVTKIENPTSYRLATVGLVCWWWCWFAMVAKMGEVVVVVVVGVVSCCRCCCWGVGVVLVVVVVHLLGDVNFVTLYFGGICSFLRFLFGNPGSFTFSLFLCDIHTYTDVSRAYVFLHFLLHRWIPNFVAFWCTVSSRIFFFPSADHKFFICRRRRRRHLCVFPLVHLLTTAALCSTRS